MNTKPIILAIDDETSILKTLKEVLEDEGYQIETLVDGNKAIDIIGKLIPDLVFLDIFMPNCDGIKLLKQIKKEFPTQNVIMISGFGNIQIAINSLKNGALDFIEKPLNLDEILSKISFLKNKNNQNIEKNIINIDQEIITKLSIVGNSYLFLELLQQIEPIVNVEYPLIIYGEHGTGKSLLVEYIYKKSNLSKFNLITINCSCLNENEIIESINNFYLNNSGILYLKHINNMTLNAQKILLKNIELNKNKNIRLITSSLESLLNLVKMGQFSSSLFHTLNITPLEIPSLNKRRYDIPLLCDFFLKQENSLQNKSIIFDSKSIRILRNFNWIANVTQLKNLIKYIVSSCQDKNKIISETEILSYLEENKINIIAEQTFTKFNSLKDAVNSFEKNFLLYLLKKNRYDIKQTSSNINLSAMQLKDKLLKLNVDINSINKI